jgi:hypothetical protein
MRPEIARQIRRSGDLLVHGLIDVERGVGASGGPNAWDAWCRATDIPRPEAFAMSCVDTQNAVDLAACVGHIALGGDVSAVNQLVVGTLVAPLEIAVQPQSLFWFLCKDGRADEPEIQ